MADDYEALIADIARILKDIAWGEPERVADLFRYTGDPAVSSYVAELAERIGTIIVQKEVREFQLETLIEDLFATRKALVRARHDPLTGLPNRAMFEEALGKACAQAGDCGAGLESLRRPFPLREAVRISASVGVAFSAPEASTPAALMKNADVAMYRAKGDGRDRVQVYRPSAVAREWGR